MPQGTAKNRSIVLLKDVFPESEKQWDYEKNTLSFDDVAVSSNKKAWWLCDLGHSWKISVNNRTGSGRLSSCPYCANRRVLPGFNDLATTHPGLAKQWDYEKNGNLTPQDVVAGSNRYFWWLCSLGHSWKAAGSGRASSGTGCPYCANRKVIPGFNDLATTHPNLAKQWDHKKNDGLAPQDVTFGARGAVWWVCDLGHSWRAHTFDRTRGSNCPFCFGGKFLSGFNDLTTRDPSTVDQWDYERNFPEEPGSVNSGSERKVWWKCSKGHSWVRTPYSYTRVSNRCPFCFGSRQEAEVLGFVQNLLPETLVKSRDRSVIPPLELDIYIPSLKIAIEVNGNYWHSEANGKDKNYHYNKWRKCKDQGIQLITIWEDQWRESQDLVKNMLAHRLGVSPGPRVFARKTTVAKVDNRTAREFCDTYHIQGFAPGSAYLGLEDSGGNLVALSIWRKNKTDLYLDRYCTSTTVIGGMGKLLKAGKQFARENNLSQIITFADHDVSDGGLYEKLGFTHDGELNPDYKYLVNGERKHKFGYRLKRFRSDPELLYEEGLTETQLAKLNGLERIWDSGRTRYTIDV